MSKLKSAYGWGIPVVLILLLVVAVVYQIWFGQNGYKDWLARQKKVDELIENEDRLLAQRRALTNRIEKIKYWDEALESAARETLSMVKKGEVFYEFREEG